MIERIIGTSRVTEVDAVSMRMVGAYKASELGSDEHLVLMFTALEPMSVSLSASINRIKTESVLEEKDEVRDREIRSLFYLVMGFLHHPKTNVKEAAQSVHKLLEHYGITITGESYASESSLITSLLNDLAQTDMLEAAAKLSGCPETIASLQTAQADFESTRIIYEQEKAQESTKQNATEIKAEVLKLVNSKIVVYLRAMEVVAPEIYGNFAQTIAQIIADNNVVAKKRRKQEEPVA